jgi:dTDP-4-amino-4,6-dideoxygalactose transaminase
MAVFSFHPVKAITSAEGGMVTLRDERLRDRLLLFRSHGLTKDPQLLTRNDGGWYQEQHELGFNYRLTDLQSALGLSQLGKLERFIGRRNEIATRYRELLADIEEIELPPAAHKDGVHAYHLFPIRFRDAATRRRAYDALREEEIYAQVHYPPVHLHPYYRRTYGYTEGMYPEAERFYAQALSLPCFPGLTDAEQDMVASALHGLQ